MIEVAEQVVGRFAPSPTGPLHFGSLVAALGSFLFARSAGGRWLVRIEDIDRPRVEPGAESRILATLEAFGLNWDGELVRQSERTGLYEGALAVLRGRGSTFECACSRAEIRLASSAPSARDPIDASGPIYPGTCRNGIREGRTARATRFRVPDDVIEFDDIVLGRVRENLARETGDFVIKRADGLHAYQLAVVVDDLAQGVNQVVRGSDLLSSTARQIALIRALGGTQPRYAHLPLVTDTSGEKLSKRNGSLPLTMDERSISRRLSEALRTLGQNCPLEDTPARILQHALATFDPRRIGTSSVVVPNATNRELEADPATPPTRRTR